MTELWKVKYDEIGKRLKTAILKPPRIRLHRRT